jgi:argininosuccinate lyase
MQTLTYSGFTIGPAVPFREAYRRVGQEIEDEEYSYHTALKHTLEGSMGNLCHDKIAERFHRLVELFRVNK